MLRTSAIGLACALAFAASLASPAGAMGGRMSGGGSMHSTGAGAGISGGSSTTGIRSVGTSGPSFVGRDMSHDLGHMRMADHDFGRDHDFDHDHDRFRHFRFFPTLAFDIGTHADNYDFHYECWNVIRVRTRLGWRWRRIWVCN